jgi:hypothetical protein
MSLLIVVVRRYEWKDEREIDIIDIVKGMQLSQDGIPVPEEGEVEEEDEEEVEKQEVASPGRETEDEK